MSHLSRRRFLTSVSAAALIPAGLGAQTSSLSDVGSAIAGTPMARVFTASEIITLDPATPSAQAVAVVGDRILTTGTLDQVVSDLGDQPYSIDRTFDGKVIVPGFIAQHDHPMLAALTLSSEVLSIEDWQLPGGTIPAVKDKDDFITRLAAAVEARTDPAEPVLSWGYHPSFFGLLTRADLDQISSTRPIIVWARSCHEFIINTAAMERGGLSAEAVKAFTKSQQQQMNFDEGRYWEQGMYALLPFIAGMIGDPKRLHDGLVISRDYMHAHGITFGNEPGGIHNKPVQDGVNAVFGAPDMPFRWEFMVDGKSLVGKYKDDAEVLAKSDSLADWYTGKTSQAHKQVKLFADGAIYSQLMQVREPYLDNHKGEWMMELKLFERAFRLYWDAGYQIHVHVNGDAGVDRVLNALENNLRRNPRYDHRTVLVHFAVSAPDQIGRIKRLGAIVSANPYYVTALADNYSKVGLGPKRANAMVRLGDVSRAGISFSLHSDMPMAPASPLFLMWCAVNRVTTSGRVAGPEQRITVLEALRGVTIEAAFSLQKEHELGNVSPGKLANFTVLEDNPLTVAPEAIKDIAVWGTVLEGEVLPVAGNRDQAALDLPSDTAQDYAVAALTHALNAVHTH